MGIEIEGVAVMKDVNIKKITIRNFRSIKSQEIELAPIVLFYGPTGSGKSTVLYSFICIKNFINNPNQQPDGFFNIGFLNLGGLGEVVFNKEEDLEVELSYTTSKGQYTLSLSKKESKIYLKTFIDNSTVNLGGQIPVPYTLNKNFSQELKLNDNEFTVNWNGITASVTPKQPTSETNQKAYEIARKINEIPEAIKKIDIAPHKRGFFQPHYTPSQVSFNPWTENEIATIIINDPNLAPKISIDLEKIAGREFRLYTPPGTSTVYFQTTEKKSKVPTYIVNDGFGINQIVYILAKIYRPEIKTILIEEPEIHLHPTVVRKFIRTLCSIIQEEEKQIIITTHSEQFVSSLLSAIAEKIIKPEDVKVYLTQKEKKETVFKEQKANEKGQVEGGLSSFIEAELEDLRTMLGIKE